MKRYIITIEDKFSERGAFVRANSKEEAEQIFRKNYKLFKSEKIISIESEDEAGCRIED